MNERRASQRNKKSEFENNPKEGKRTVLSVTESTPCDCWCDGKPRRLSNSPEGREQRGRLIDLFSRSPMRFSALFCGRKDFPWVLALRANPFCPAVLYEPADCSGRATEITRKGAAERFSIGTDSRSLPNGGTIAPG
ncbi:MAG: hypothetical protein ABSA46_01110 [Thermodesulfovibrionales bacterium]